MRARHEARGVRERRNLEWRASLRSPLLPLFVLALAFWPTWQWLVARAASDAADALGLISLATAAVLLRREHSAAARTPLAPNVSWSLPAVVVAIYTCSFSFLPPLAHAILAMTALAAACSSLWLGKKIDLRVWVLLLLVLPIVPTLNFYLGYPLRVVVGEAAAALLQLNGLAVLRDGATLVWGAKQVSIDAPCSGIKMLWTGLYASCALAAAFRLDARKFIALTFFALAAVLLANVLRATALFYVEAGVISQLAPAHEGIGIATFALATASIAAAAAKLRAPGTDRETVHAG
jgi:exosortase/archaeosortase family protein